MHQSFAWDTVTLWDVSMSRQCHKYAGLLIPVKWFYLLYSFKNERCKKISLKLHKQGSKSYEGLSGSVYGD